MKLKLTKREIAAVKASIKHWQRDIQKPLMGGRKISDEGILIWEDNNEGVKIGWGECALCMLTNIDCKKCPYSKKHGGNCCRGKRAYYTKFCDNPNLRTCNAMIRALEKILED